MILSAEDFLPRRTSHGSLTTGWRITLPGVWYKIPNINQQSVLSISFCDIVSKNGNLLLNVGPYADGSFHPDAVRILEEIGDWLALNGEAIYETRPFKVAAEGPTTVDDANYDVGKIQEQLDKGDAVDVHSDTLTAQDFRFTTHGDALYAIAFGWPEDGEFRIRTLRKGGALDGEIKKVTMLGNEGELAFCRKKKTGFM